MLRRVGGIKPIVLVAGPFTMRPPTATDAVDAQAMLLDADMQQWMPGPSDLSLDGVKEWCERSADWSDGTFAMWIITDGARIVGTALLVHIDVDDQRTASVAYRTASWARRRGVATEATIRLSDFAFDALGLERLEIHHAVENTASCGVAHRAGYLLEGTLAKGYRDNSGQRWDTHLHGRVSHRLQPSPVASTAHDD
jgi:RimJ/RimL family protein N-acetyltransferase